MTTLSRLEIDQSDRLAKRFAMLAASYFDHPESARSPAALVPLENLFRILQMYRYSSFADDRRSGVLALRPLSESLPFEQLQGDWHKNIEAAVATALESSFGKSVPPDQAVQQIQAALAWLATDKDAPPEDVRARCKSFLERLSTSLN